MIDDMNIWLDQYIQRVRSLFGDRVFFIGLQGSYGRNEPTKDSDIDMVLILDNVTVKDLLAYDETLTTMPYREKICGFVSGKNELYNWEKSDLFHFYYDTIPILGNIDDLRDRIKKEDIQKAILTGACNIYHTCGHNIVHEKDKGMLKALYKSAILVLKAICFEKNGEYLKNTQKLESWLRPEDQQILLSALKLKEQQSISQEEFILLSQQLVNWAGNLIRVQEV